MAFLPPLIHFNCRPTGHSVHVVSQSPVRCLLPSDPQRRRRIHLSRSEPVEYGRALSSALSDVLSQLNDAVRDRSDIRVEQRQPLGQQVQHGRTSRRLILRAFGTFCALSAAAHMGATEVDGVVSSLRAARKKLDDADALIDTGRWDGVRTLLASSPIREAQDAVKRSAASSAQDVRGAWVGLREDTLSSAKLLDAAVYSNVFIGEDRKILGTVVDFDTPRIYLQQLKDAYDELVSLSEAS